MNNSLAKITTAILLISLIGSLFSNLYGQSDEGFIYGKVTTIDDQVYQGQLRWGKEEAFWTDHFNASKKYNKYVDYLTSDQIDDLRGDHNWSMGNWIFEHGDDDERFLHQVVCQFGEMSAIEIIGRERALVTFQNGNKLKISGSGYNDIGTKIRIQDPEIGMISIRWSQIELVEFMPTPAKLEDRMGSPLYGDVFTSGGKYTGFVQWDHDERLSTDKLDGETSDGDVSIAFGKIKTIVNEGSSSFVTLKSGRKFDLRGTNDVNRQNKGIIVTLKDGTRIDVPWEEFDKVAFVDKIPDPGKSYASFKNQKELTGMVTTTDGDTYKGKIVYDLDEAMDYEVIQGKYNGLEYFIPLRQIKKITPKNYDNSFVEFRNGQKLLLGDAQDVSDRNDGILVFQDNKKPVYVAWDDVEEVTFN